MPVEETRVLLSHRECEVGALSSLMTVFQRDDSQVLRKTFLDCKPAKRLGEYLYLKRAEKEVCSKVKCPKKRRQGTYSHEEITLKFSQPEGKIEAVLVGIHH